MDRASMTRDAKRKVKMKFAKLFFAVWLCSDASGVIDAGAADKVIISYSSRSYAFLPAQVAVARGYFKDENLDPLLIQMRS
ncbi:MAG TPA: hypothetical protein VNT76_10890, partial [Candidatus Binatus sp.]|nr:hypothetical protein [Candidatus Binatus sp.]